MDTKDIVDIYQLEAFFADIKQWGVYQDYGYTPNPELRGWSNDHPFPPEILVENPALVHRQDSRARGHVGNHAASRNPEEVSEHPVPERCSGSICREERGSDECGGETFPFSERLST